MNAVPPPSAAWPAPDAPPLPAAPPQPAWDALPCALLQLDAAGCVTGMNREARELLAPATPGVGAAMVVAAAAATGWPGVLRPDARAQWHSAVAGRREAVLSLQRTDGRWLEARLRWDAPAAAASSATADDRRGGGVCVLSDASPRHAAESAARDAEERLGKFMQASAEGILFHRDGVVTDANPPLCELLGRPLHELVGRAVLDFVAPEQAASVSAAMAAAIDTSYETVVVDRSGQCIPVECTVRTLWRQGEPLRMALVRDLRSRDATRARIDELAHRDSLTGLPNRSAFMATLGERLLAARAGEGMLALLFIDLDHFKRVNESLGHASGDVLLRTLARRIGASLRTTDLVARYGGDEFMVLLPGVGSRRDVEDVASKLQDAIARPVMAEGRPISVTPSMGIAMFPEHGDAAPALIQHADTAMYIAKARGRAQHLFFDPAMANTAYAALVLEGELAQALQRGEFELHFQPQVMARGKALAGAEALIRWRHPQRGLLWPGDFIELAEQQRLMVPIGQWVLREAARCAARWHAAGHRIGPVAVNLSAMQFHAADFVDSVAQVLREEGTDGRLIELELTERMLLEDLGEVNATLGRLAQLGIRISVDDFGTGYSSLGQLKDLPVDKLKIDASFVRDLPHDRSSAAIARALIQMGRKLGITVIAEGVETEAQWSFLALAGCAELQGDLISPPLPAAAFEAWMNARPVAPEPPAAPATTNGSNA